MTIHEALGSQKSNFAVGLTNCCKEFRRTHKFSLFLAAIITLLFVLVHSVGAQDCVNCEDPTVNIGFTASVCSHHDYTVTLNGTSVTGSGSCASDIWVTTYKAYAALTVDQTYVVTAGTGSCSTHIVFDVPKDYKLEIEGVEKTVIDQSGGAKGSGDGTWKIVVRKKCPCPNEGLGQPCNTKAGSVEWSVSMGSLSDGRSAQNINLFQETLTSAIYSPSALIYSPPGLTNEVDVIRNPDQSLRQIKATEGLADFVVTIPGQEYEIRFYRAADVGIKVNGLYLVTGLPPIVWKINNPDPSSSSKLQISKTQSGFTDVSEFAWDAITNNWSLTRGGGARIETKSITHPTATSRNETTTVKESNGQIVSRIMRTFHTFGWGEELLQEIVDPDGAALKTLYTYYEDATDAGRYGKIKSIAHPDGSWEKYDYDSIGNLTLLMRPWKDLTLASVTEGNSYVTRYTYSNFDGIVTSLYARHFSTIEEQITGVTVRKTTFARSGLTINGQPATREVVTSFAMAGATLTTTTTKFHYSADPFYANRLISIEHADGQSQTRAFEKGNYVPNADPALSQFTPDANGTAQRETVIHGTTASPNGVAFKTLKETSILDQYGRIVLEESYVYDGAAYERVGWTAIDYDDLGQLTQTRSHTGEITTNVWNGNRKISQTDANGIQKDYTYDALVRVKTETKKGVPANGSFPAQVDVVTTYNYDAEGHVTGETVTGGSLSLTTSRVFDKAGRLVRVTDQAGLITTHAHTNGGRTQTVTRPGGATEVTDKYLDGQTKTVTGSAVIARACDYGVNADGTRFKQEFVGSDGLNSPRWTKQTIDWIDREVSVEKPSFTGTNVLQSFFYNTLGQRQKQTTLAGTTKLIADTLYEYDDLGRQTRTGLDINADGILNLLSTDRLTESDTIFEKVGTDWFSVMTSRGYLTDNNDTPVTEIQRVRLNNFPLNGTEQTISEVTLTDVAGNNTRATVSIDRGAKKQTSTTASPDSNLNAVAITVNGLLQSSTVTTPQSAITYTYDSLGRQTGVTDPRTGTTTRSYSSATGQLSSTNDGAGTTNYEYYEPAHTNAGRLKTQTNAVGKKIYFNYSSRGELVQTWGDASYPLEYVYNSYGERTELHTFRHGMGWSASAWPASTTGTADVTKWIYQESTGLVTQKQDAALKGASYTYDELGRVKTRVWARGITCTYGYDANTGDLCTVTYSDSTPAVTFAYDRGGRQSNVTDAAGTHTRTFNVSGEMQTEQIAGGILDGVNINVGFDGFLRRNSLQTSHNTTMLSSQTYGYDANSRLETITSGSQTVTYGYYPNSGLLNTTSFTGGTNIARSYDGIGRLENISTTPAADAAQSYTYTYNNLNQRTRVTREDGSYWSYIYNDRGELISGKKYWSDNAIVWGAQTEFSFDNIGNRNFAKNGGNQLGSLRQSNYTANSLNQYSQRTVPSSVDVTGTANTAATVSVNNQATMRKGDYFYRELAVDNTTAPVSAQINVVGARNNFGAGGEDAITEKGGRVFIPPSVETFTHDDDGNLTSDGRWNYTWDAENRLISMEASTNVPIEARQRLEFAYDHMSRRIHKKVFVWNSAAASYELQSVRKFVYDGWNLMSELNAGNGIIKSYVWGQDISGTLQGAGGIGSLLVTNENGETYHFGCDGNGNVTSVVKANTGKFAAVYEYDPFGATLRSTGEYAELNTFKFSTKYEDRETGLVYYGYRYYNPEIGRWVSRDPIDELGGINLYGFLSNNGISYTDILGLAKRYLVGDTLFYSCNCGWIDTGHMRAENAQELLNKVRANTGRRSLTGLGFLVEHSQSAGKKIFGVFLGYSVGSGYFVKYNLIPADQESVALGIYKEVSEMMERRQSARIQDAITSSGFSGEDLISNLIGFYRAVRGYTKDQALELCKKLSKEISLKIWDANGGIRKSRSWKPVFYNDLGCCKDKPQWPKEFDSIEEAPKAYLWKWRDWSAGIDFRPGQRYP